MAMMSPGSLFVTMIYLGVILVTIYAISSKIGHLVILAFIVNRVLRLGSIHKTAMDLRKAGIGNKLSASSNQRQGRTRSSMLALFSNW
jgi:hypothetical protein